MAVLLGSIIFQRREIPDIMPWGGAHHLVIHKLVGGTRVIDAMGPDPRPIEWRGLFLGPTATQRARICDAMKDSGAEIPLSWGSFYEPVVISHFHADYKHEWEVHYQIACELVTNTSGGGLFSLDNDILGDISIALDIGVS